MQQNLALNMFGDLLLAAMLSLSLLGNGCHGAPVAWDYKTNDPSKWPTLFQKWCGSRTQSPIKLAFGDAAYDSDLPAYTLAEESLSGLKYQVYNDGHKIAIVFSSVMPNVSVPGHPGSCFRPQSMHWHWGADNSQGSEHWLEGQRYPMEGHIVMWNCQFYSSYMDALDGFGGLAVLGVMYEPDTTGTAGLSPGLSNVLGMLSSNSQLQQCPGCKNESFAPPLLDMSAFSLQDVLPADRSQYYLYSGSLTTPDCRENVMWTVYKQPLRVPPAFLATFRGLKYPDGAAMVGNFRPTLALNPADPFGARRMVVRSFSSSSGGGGGGAVLPSAGVRHRASLPGVAAAVAAVVWLLTATPLTR